MTAAKTKIGQNGEFTPSQYHKAMAEIEDFIAMGFENLSEKQSARLNDLSDKVHQYESRKYPMPMANSVSGILQGYMVENNLSRTELGNTLKVSGSTISDILNGKKGISFPLAVKMHQILKIDAEELLNVSIVSPASTLGTAYAKKKKSETKSDRQQARRTRSIKKTDAKKATARK